MRDPTDLLLKNIFVRFEIAKLSKFNLERDFLADGLFEPSFADGLLDLERLLLGDRECRLPE